MGKFLTTSSGMITMITSSVMFTAAFVTHIISWFMQRPFGIALFHEKARGWHMKIDETTAQAP